MRREVEVLRWESLFTPAAFSLPLEIKPKRCKEKLMKHFEEKNFFF